MEGGLCGSGVPFSCLRHHRVPMCTSSRSPRVEGRVRLLAIAMSKEGSGTGQTVLPGTSQYGHGSHLLGKREEQGGTRQAVAPVGF